MAHCLRLAALLFEHLQIALDTVLDVGCRKIARIDQVALDEAAGHAGALLELAQHQQLADAEGIAALDAVDHEAVGVVLADVALEQLDARGQSEVGVAAQAILGQASRAGRAGSWRKPRS